MTCTAQRSSLALAAVFLGVVLNAATAPRRRRAYVVEPDGAPRDHVYIWQELTAKCHEIPIRVVLAQTLPTQTFLDVREHDNGCLTAAIRRHAKSRGRIGDI